MEIRSPLSEGKGPPPEQREARAEAPREGRPAPRGGMEGGAAEPLLGRAAAGARGGGRGAAAAAAARRRAGGVGVVVFCVLAGDANRGLLLPTLQPYLGRFGGSALGVGACNAAFSLGRLLAAPLYGLWMDRRSPGEPLLAALGFAALANLVYTYAGQLGGGGAASIAIVFISRGLCGVGASVLGVGRGYIGKTTSRADRAPFIALLCASQYAGFTLSAFVSALPFPQVGWLGVDLLNMPGLLLVGLQVLAAAALLALPSDLFGRESRGLAAGRPRGYPSYPDLMDLERCGEHPLWVGAGTSYGEGGAGQEGASPHPPVRVAPPLVALLKVPGVVGAFIFLNFAVRAVLATLETLATPIIAYLLTGSTNPTDWANTGALTFVSHLFTALGVLGLINFAVLFFVSRKVPLRVLLACGTAITLAGSICMLDLGDGQGRVREISLTRFEAGLGVAWALGYPVTQTVVVSALSKVLTREQQGLWMGNLAAAGSAGRIMAPLLAGFLYTELESHTGLVPVAFCATITLLACLLIAAYWTRLKDDCEGEDL